MTDAPEPVVDPNAPKGIDISFTTRTTISTQLAAKENRNSSGEITGYYIGQLGLVPAAQAREFALFILEGTGEHVVPAEDVYL